MTVEVAIINRPVEVSVIQAAGRVVKVTTRPAVVVQARSVGIQGPPGAGGGAGTFTQASPATLWTVNHNLGYRPQVTILTMGGVEIEAAVQHVSTNQFTVTFNTAQAGLAEYQ